MVILKQNHRSLSQMQTYSNSWKSSMAIFRSENATKQQL